MPGESTQPQEVGIGKPPADRHGPKAKKHNGFLILLLLAGIILGTAIAYELSQRKAQEHALAASVGVIPGASAPIVNVARVRFAPSESTVELPGQTMALAETPIYARTDGYISKRYVEIGDRVKKGQKLIELDTPDLDQQIEQARATLAQSKAALAQLQANLQASQSSLKLAKVTAQRTEALADEGVLSKQDRDSATAALENGQANVHAAEEAVRAQDAVIVANDANLKRLVETKNYARMEAPFDGVITFRNQAASDVGTLVSSGSGTSVKEVLRISQLGTLRIFVNVPQTYAPVVRVGETAQLAVDEFAGRVFSAQVSSATGSVDPSSRTMLTILEVDNSAGALLPGMSVKVRFRLPHTVNVLRVPGDALIFRAEGTFVATVDQDHKIRLKQLVLGRDYGSEVEATSGLDPMDLVVLNPTDAIHDGVVVDPKERSVK